ncbi:hypothetical protein B0T21DRAFT_65136 [Apiosordaria backusii]|uniref:Heterokaryon incompatibility domain-containing protein n=1 Tax=Apiosordaria backusii TaxID=314023 RepID=A0AA40AIV1_9PEZI|nr:hypothetical protein B0T21DRAFT_65136 [Apiosordaria backusii]
MRLINVRTKRLEKFYPEPPEPYAILSHTWGREEEELSFQGMQALDSCDVSRRAKLNRSCEQASKDGINYIWIDTCCIDKSSTVELSEAINSMFRWYQNSKICYAYLSDVKTGQPHEICQSRWFTRGWTLQELLAPRKVTFFDSAWAQLGTKSSLSVTIEEATGLPHHILTGFASLRECSVAQRMSWASRRMTTRPEDMAYCLVGIFDVDITPSYGIGLERAFGRLQEAIMKQIPDDSILAWSLGSMEDQQEQLKTALPAVSGGILATSPADFKYCGDIVRRPSSGIETHIRAFDIFGGTMPISISLSGGSSPSSSRPKVPVKGGFNPGSPTPNNPTNHVIYGYLSCSSKSNPSFVVAIPLVSCHDERFRAHSKPVFIRPHGLHTVYIRRPSHIPSPEIIWIRNDRPGDIPPPDDKAYWIYLPPKPYPWNAKLDEVYPSECFEREMAMIKTPRPHKFVADTEETLFLARFSYTLETTGSFILALRFFRESVTGAKEPLPYLYFDDQYSPTPLSTIAKLWSSLLYSATKMIVPSQVPSVVLSASMRRDTIDRHPLWVVDLSSIPLSTETSFIPPDWPNISDQITLRMECAALIQCVWDGAKLSRKYQLNMSDLASSDMEIERTRKELERVNSEIVALKVRAEGLQYRLDRRAAHRLSLHNINATLSSKIDAISAKITEAENSDYVKRLWPRNPEQTTYAPEKQSLVERYKKEHDGVMAHILHHHPVMLWDTRTQMVQPLGPTNGMTLLMYAAATGDPEMVYHVLKYDDDCLARDAADFSAKTWARRSELSEFESMCADWKRGDLDALERIVNDFYRRNSEAKRKPVLSLPPIPPYNSILSAMPRWPEPPGQYHHPSLSTAAYNSSLATIPVHDSNLVGDPSPIPTYQPAYNSRLSVDRLDKSPSTSGNARRDKKTRETSLETGDHSGRLGINLKRPKYPPFRPRRRYPPLNP